VRRRARARPRFPGVKIYINVALNLAAAGGNG